MPSQPGQLQPLVHSLLGIQSAGIAVTGKEKSERSLKHNVVDRERVLVPPAWDSWGKIRVLREGFDVEGISRAWGVEIQHVPAPKSQPDTIADSADDAVPAADEDALLDDVDLSEDQDAAEELETDTTAFLYEQTIQDPHPPSNTKPSIDVPCTPDQQFFASQLDRLEAYRAEDETAKKAVASARRATGGTAAAGSQDDSITSRAMTEHIGPVQFNVGGIQYDADEALKRIKERNKPATTTTPDRKRSSRDMTPFTPTSPPNTADASTTKDIPTENLEAYFASLMKKGQRSGGTNSPRPSKETS